MLDQINRSASSSLAGYYRTILTVSK